MDTGEYMSGFGLSGVVLESKQEAVDLFFTGGTHKILDVSFYHKLILI